MNLTELVNRQSTIISMQSEVINELFQTISNYVTVEELDNMPATKKNIQITEMTGK